MPEWLTKFAKRILSLTPDKEWFILIRIEKNKAGATWIVEELPKIETAVEKFKAVNVPLELEGQE